METPYGWCWTNPIEILWHDMKIPYPDSGQHLYAWLVAAVSRPPGSSPAVSTTLEKSWNNIEKMGFNGILWDLTNKNADLPKKNGDLMGIEYVIVGFHWDLSNKNGGLMEI